MNEYEMHRNLQLMNDYAKNETLATRLRARITGEKELPAVVFVCSTRKLTELAMSANASIKKMTYAGIEDLYFDYLGIRYQCPSGRTM